MKKLCVLGLLLLLALSAQFPALAQRNPNCSSGGVTFEELSTTDTSSGRITNGTYYVAYCLRITTAPITLTFSLERTSGNLDPYLVIMNADADVLAQNDDISSGVNKDSRITYTFSRTGIYLIAATRWEGESGTSTGSFTLSVSRSSASRACGTLHYEGVRLYNRGRFYYDDAWIALNASLLENANCADTYLYLGLLNVELYDNCRDAIVNWTIYAGLKYPNQDLGTIITNEPLISTYYIICALS